MLLSTLMQERAVSCLRASSFDQVSGCVELQSGTNSVWMARGKGYYFTEVHMLFSYVVPCFPLPDPPELILVDPLGREVNRTAPAAVELSCTAAGLPLPTIYWMRNDVLLVDGEEGVEVTVVTGTDEVVSQLRIVSSRYEDRGNYSCTAVNVAGEDSFTFQVFVRGECVKERDVCVCVSLDWGEHTLCECKGRG